MQASKTVPSPCIRNCCLDKQDICLGCFRSLQEITGWGAATDLQRTEILARVAERKAQRTNPPI